MSETTELKLESEAPAVAAKPVPRTIQQLVHQIELAREERLLSKNNKPTPRANNYASSIPVCARQGVYEFVAYDQKKPFDAHLLARFEEGDRQEEWVIIELKKLGQQLGFRIVEEQVYLHPDMIRHYKLSGKIDGKIEFYTDPNDRRTARRVPLEIKSMHPMFYDNCKNVDDLKHDAFLSRYYRQCLAYMYGHAETECVLVVTDCLGHFRFIVIPQDLQATQEFLDTLEKVNMFVEENHGITDESKWKLPERIPYDVDICGKCNFNHICLPDVISKSRVRFANDQQLATNIARHEEIKPVAKEYERVHEELKEHFNALKTPLIVVGDAPSYVISGKMTKGRPSLADESEWAPDELEAFKKLKAKYTNQEPGWSWSVEVQEGRPAGNVAQSGAIPASDVKDAVTTLFGESAKPREKLDVATSPQPKAGAAEAAANAGEAARTAKPKIKIV